MAVTVEKGLRAPVLTIQTRRPG